MTGRQLFMTNKSLFQDEALASDATNETESADNAPPNDDDDGDDDSDNDDDDNLPEPPGKDWGDGSSGVDAAAHQLNEDLYLGDEEDLDDLDDLDDD